MGEERRRRGDEWGWDRAEKGGGRDRAKKRIYFESLGEGCAWKRAEYGFGVGEFFWRPPSSGRELTEFLSACHLCANVNSASFSQNSPSLPQNSVTLAQGPNRHFLEKRVSGS